jgi:hypothetical protein
MENPPDELDLVRYLHRTLADIYELLNPRAATPHQNSVAAHAKARAALKAAAESGVLS